MLEERIRYLKKYIEQTKDLEGPLFKDYNHVQDYHLVNDRYLQVEASRLAMQDEVSWLEKYKKHLELKSCVAVKQANESNSFDYSEGVIDMIDELLGEEK